MAANGNAQNGDLRQEQRETVGTDDITPDAVEKKLIDETHDTGAAAYQFNPDASPEEKASAARGVCPSDHPCRLFTDPLPIRMCPRTSIISISPRASLSSRTRLVLFLTVVDPPLLTGCIQENEGAPENKDLPPASSPDEIKKEDAGDAAAGKEQMTDDQRWARDRTGWAPRFMIESTEDEGTLLDHQTLLEGKLSDKFFGGMWLPGNRHMPF